MNITCEIIEDLLPLYADNICSIQSRQTVEQHLQICNQCRAALERTQAIPVPHIEPDRPSEDKAVKKGFRKIRIRWWASILLVIIAAPLLLLGWNQYHNRGIHYSNIYEYKVGREFMDLIADGNYEKAFRYFDIEGLKASWRQEWFEEERLSNIEEDALAKFCELGKKLEEAGGIDRYEYIGISMSGVDSNGTNVYVLVFKANICGETKTIHVYVSNHGVRHFCGGGSFIDDPLAQFSIWSEYLWQDYEGCYFDPDLKEYVYYDQDR